MYPGTLPGDPVAVLKNSFQAVSQSWKHHVRGRVAMLAEQVEGVIEVNTHRDTLAAPIVSSSVTFRVITRTLSPFGAVRGRGRP